MNALAKEADVVLGVSGANLDEIYDTVAALEKAGNKNLIIDATGASLKETYANAVQIRRAALKDQDRTFGYPTIVNTSKLAVKDKYMQEALVSLFTMKYGSIVVVASSLLYAPNSELCRSESTTIRLGLRSAPQTLAVQGRFSVVYWYWKQPAAAGTFFEKHSRKLHSFFLFLLSICLKLLLTFRIQ